MAYDSFDVYFNGEILPEHDLATVRSRVGELFKLDARGIDKLFCGEPVRIKQDVDVDKAARYRERFRLAGALVQIVPHGQSLAAPPAAKPVAATEAAAAASASAAGLDLMPANTGSLEDCAPPPANFAEPDLSDLDLAAPGATIDETETPPPVAFDIDDLSMAPAGTGSLEDCRSEATPEALPDISALDLEQAGITLDESEAPAPPAIDTSELSVAPANSGSLEDCALDKPPAPIPDISDLKLVDD